MTTSDKKTYISAIDDTTCPSNRLMMRPANPASRWLCVTITMVVPSLFSSVSNCITSSPFFESRLPVGSSARIIFGPEHHGTGNGHTLLLTSRQLLRIMLRTVTDVHPFQYLAHTALALVRGNVQVGERKLHVLKHVQLVNQVKALEHEADISLAHVGAVFFSSGSPTSFPSR